MVSAAAHWPAYVGFVCGEEHILVRYLGHLSEGTCMDGLGGGRLRLKDSLCAAYDSVVKAVPAGSPPSHVLQLSIPADAMLRLFMLGKAVRTRRGGCGLDIWLVSMQAFPVDVLIRQLRDRELPSRAGPDVELASLPRIPTRSSDVGPSEAVADVAESHAVLDPSFGDIRWRSVPTVSENCLSRRYLFFLCGEEHVLVQYLEQFSEGSCISALRGERLAFKETVYDASIMKQKLERNRLAAHHVLELRIAGSSLLQLFMTGMVLRTSRGGFGIDMWSTPIHGVDLAVAMRTVLAEELPTGRPLHSQRPLPSSVRRRVHAPGIPTTGVGRSDRSPESGGALADASRSSASTGAVAGAAASHV